MLEEKSLHLLRSGLQRIFALDMCPLTYREVQNILIQAVNNNKQQAEAVLQALFTGEVPETLVVGKTKQMFDIIMNEYAIPVRLSKEILERGEFLNVLTSDTLENNDKVVLLNRLRRIDGDDFHFLTDPETTIHVLDHFATRLSEYAKTEKGKKVLNPFKKNLDQVKQKIESI